MARPLTRHRFVHVVIRRRATGPAMKLGQWSSAPLLQRNPTSIFKSRRCIAAAQMSQMSTDAFQTAQSRYRPGQAREMLVHLEPSSCLSHWNSFSNRLTSDECATLPGFSEGGAIATEEVKH